MLKSVSPLDFALATSERFARTVVQLAVQHGSQVIEIDEAIALNIPATLQTSENLCVVTLPQNKNFTKSLNALAKAVVLSYDDPTEDTPSIDGYKYNPVTRMSEALSFCYKNVQLHGDKLYFNLFTSRAGQLESVSSHSQRSERIERNERQRVGAIRKRSNAA